MPAKRGQVLVSLIISTGVFIILSHALFSLVFSSYRLISFTRARVSAKHLAQERVELTRNLAYNNVGTVGGIVPGSVPQVEQRLVNGLLYSITTSVVYVDDPFDGTAPTDTLANDYKRVRVDISWEGVAPSRGNPVTLITDIAPRGIETTVGGGTLSILVFDANANPVPQASAHIVANAVTPAVDTTLETNSQGRMILPGALACNQCYQITVTKDGYSTERTYSSTEVANPSKPHQSVLEGELTEISFAIDRLSTIHLSSHDSRENGFTALGNVNFILQGEKIIGTDATDIPVYKYEESFSTDASGALDIPDLEWDNYTILMPDPTSYDISGTKPLIPFILSPNEELDVAFSVEAHSDHGLLSSFIDPSQNPISEVTATLTDDADYEEIITSGLETDPDFGQAFFPNLSAQTYHLQAEADGYQTTTLDLNVSGQSSEEIILSPE
jgi:hypothetical protein